MKLLKFGESGAGSLRYNFTKEFPAGIGANLKTKFYHCDVTKAFNINIKMNDDICTHVLSFCTKKCRNCIKLPSFALAYYARILNEPLDI